MSEFLKRIQPYVTAAAFVAAAAFATAATRVHGAPSYALLLVAVFASAWYSGPLPGFAAIVAATVFSHKMFPQRGEEETIRIVLFLAASIALTVWTYREKRLKGAVEESNRRFRLLMESVADYAIIVTDTEGMILDFSSGTKRILGFAETDKGRSLEMIFPKGQRNAFIEELTQAKEFGETKDEKWHVRKDGTLFWGYGILTALYDPAGMLKGYVKILRDLTAQKIAEEERNRLFQELEKTNGILEQMVAVLAHDIRAPLTTIMGWSAMRRRGNLKEPSEVDRAFEVIERNAEKQLQLMEGLLELSRVKSGQEAPNFTSCDLSAIILEALETVRPAATRKELQVDVFDSVPRIINGNPAWLSQVFINIFQNAVKFTPAGGAIRVTCFQSAGFFHTEISDTGIGIPSELIADIFLPFKRGTARMAGTGLGLAIVRELVEKHHGNVYAYSGGPGKGAPFVVDLPVRFVPGDLVDKSAA